MCASTENVLRAEKHDDFIGVAVKPGIYIIEAKDMHMPWRIAVGRTITIFNLPGLLQ